MQSKSAPTLTELHRFELNCEAALLFFRVKDRFVANHRQRLFLGISTSPRFKIWSEVRVCFREMHEHYSDEVAIWYNYNRITIFDVTFTAAVKEEDVSGIK